MCQPYWEHYPHPADMGIRGFGRTKEEAFEQAALALAAVVADPGSVIPTQRIDIDCQQQDNDELLLVEWLNSIVYEMATRRMLFGRFRVRFEDGGLRGQAWGELLDVERHRPTVEVKAATYCDLAVRRGRDGLWMAQCIVDV